MSTANELKSYGNPSYGLTRRLGKVDFRTARDQVVAALKTEGFGVLTEIDVQATMQAKLGLDYPPYVILGACNPKLANLALTAEPGVGLLLPCNVVVTQQTDGDVVASAIDPIKMFVIAERPDLEPIAAQVRQKLQNVMQAIVVDPSVP